MSSFWSQYEHLVERGALTERRLHRVIHTAKQRQRGLMVIMEDVHNPHNLAAIARSCDAFGIQNVAFTMQNEELFNPHDVSKISSASASKWLDYRIFEDGTRDALTMLKSEGWHIMATWVNPQTQSIYDVDFTQYDKLALMVGNEHAGISLEAVELADSTVYVPMSGMIESFNVSVAAAITLFEINRQRKASGKDYTLPPDELDALVADFVMRAIRPDRRRFHADHI